MSHVYYEDKLYNGFPADSVTSLGALHCGIDKVDGKGITSRGVLLDVVRHRGVQTFLELGNPITPAELDVVRLVSEGGDIGGMQRVAASDPNSVKRRHDVAVIEGRIGDALMAKDDCAGANARYSRSFDTLRALAVKGNPKANIDVIGQLADKLLSCRNFTKSLEVSDFSISIAPELTWLYAARAIVGN